MPTLAELQRAFAAAIRADTPQPLANWIEGGMIAPEDRLRIHRNTMLAALAGALRLTYPVVDALVGPEFFDQAARAFAGEHPPRVPLLSLYGADFPSFLGGWPPAATLPYLADVARLEWAVEQAAQGPSADEAPPAATIALPGVILALAPSLALLPTEFPAEPIWRAVLERDDEEIGRIDPARAPSTLAVWRDGDGAAVAELGPIAATFLSRILAGEPADAALIAASEADATQDAIAAITREILSASFTQLTPTDSLPPQGEHP